MCHAELCRDCFKGNWYFDFLHRSVSVPDITLWLLQWDVQGSDICNAVIDRYTIQIQLSPQEIVEKVSLLYFGTKWCRAVISDQLEGMKQDLKISFLRFNDEIFSFRWDTICRPALLWIRPVKVYAACCSLALKILCNLFSCYNHMSAKNTTVFINSCTELLSSR